jgi:hypothetical protein
VRTVLLWMSLKLFSIIFETPGEAKDRHKVRNVCCPVSCWFCKKHAHYGEMSSTNQLSNWEIKIICAFQAQYQLHKYERT